MTVGWTAGRRLIAMLTASLACCAPAAARASALTTHGQRLRLAPHLSANANQSSNWFGYARR
jgi:hypothetical protein